MEKKQAKQLCIIQQLEKWTKSQEIIMSWEKMFLDLKQKLFQRGTGWEHWEQGLWEGTGHPKHTFSGDRMPAQTTVPFVSQSSGPALCLKCCGLEGGEEK